jgi:hypothetical protein
MAIAEMKEPPTATPTEPPSHVRMKAIRPARGRCTHCLVLVPAGERTPYGLCRVCLESEGPPVRPEREREAVTRGRNAGLRAISRPCIDGRCWSCVSMRGGPVGPLGVAPKNARRPHERSAQFSDYDAECLKRYFSKTIRAGIGVGTGSNLGSGEGTNPNTLEKPQRTEPRCPICVAAAVTRHEQRKSEYVAKKLNGIKTETAELAEIVKGDGLPMPEETAELCMALAVSEAGPPSLTAHEAEAFANPLTAGHDHSKRDREAIKPIRVYDKEIDGRLVQVQVMPPSLEPLAYASWSIQTGGDEGAGKFGAWDDDAVDYVSGREGEKRVSKILGKLATHHQDALEAYYATQNEQGSSSGLGAMAGVALLTRAAREAHGALARAGKGGTIRDTISILTKLGKAEAPTRERIRREAEELLLEAKWEYGKAASAAEAE